MFVTIYLSIVKRAFVKRRSRNDNANMDNAFFRHNCLRSKLKLSMVFVKKKRVTINSYLKIDLYFLIHI